MIGHNGANSFSASPVTPRPLNGGAGPPDVGGAQERRDLERPPRYVRYVDELDVEGGGPDEPRKARPIPRLSWLRSSPPSGGSANYLDQEGDKFMRLPEVYVKGNNVRCNLESPLYYSYPLLEDDLCSSPALQWTN